MSNQADPVTDEELVERGKLGDRDAFTMLVQRYWDKVVSWLYKMTHSTHTAEDVTQEAFCKAWSALPSYTHGPGFRAWLFRIARNTWIDQVRRNKPTAGQALIDNVASSEATPLETMEAAEQCSLLREAISELPEEYREVLLMRCDLSLSFAEIANIVESKEDTVRWRVFKARQLLLKKLSITLGNKE